MHIQRLRIAHIIRTPNALNELAASKHAAGVAHEVLQQVEFFQRHRHRLAIHRYRVALHIHAYAAALNNAVIKLINLFHLRAAAQHRADASNQLTSGIRLGHVIIRAQLKANNLVNLRVTSRDHNDGNIRLSAQLAAHVRATHARQHQVQQHQVNAVLIELLKRSRTVGRPDSVKPFLLQQIRQRLRQRFFVFNDQDCCHFNCQSFPGTCR